MIQPKDYKNLSRRKEDTTKNLKDGNQCWPKDFKQGIFIFVDQLILVIFWDEKIGKKSSSKKHKKGAGFRNPDMIFVQK